MTGDPAGKGSGRSAAKASRGVVEAPMTAPLLLCLALTQATAWQPAGDRIRTKWAAEVDPAAPLPEYPRPQMVREQWANLNGLWDYAIRPGADAEPQGWDGKILVPFPVESSLSGVGKPVPENHAVWYQRAFAVPQDWRQQRVLLHFGAVDWDATVIVNGQEISRHKGGYDAFTIDVTPQLKDGANTVSLKVIDPTDRSWQPRGKQLVKPNGIWYTAVTGIWQTVWLEPVPLTSIDRLRIDPDVDGSRVVIGADLTGEVAGLKLRVLDGEGRTLAEGPASKALAVPIIEPHLWSPDDPYLYNVSVAVADGEQIVDQVGTYFGMRKISLGKDDQGLTRILLNDQFVFQVGPLDQGWWPDGLYTAPTDEALKYDIQITRDMGFNMARKHVKVEPDRWYYWADKLGLLVWQDMPSGDGGVRPGDGEITRNPESAENYRHELTRLIAGRRNHPSIVVWVPFNEGWGQFDTKNVVDLVKSLDPTRLVTCASGWNDFAGVGDIHDIHRYPGPGMPEPEADRAIVLGEFGGLGLPLEGHLWGADRNWGYRDMTGRDQLTTDYLRLLRKLRPLVGEGLSGAVYTQTTDVEGEVNGLLSYDRAVVKMDPAATARAAAELSEPLPKLSLLLPASQQTGQPWRYTETKPDSAWYLPGFDDRTWKIGLGGFGREGTPGTVNRTKWESDDIWLRRRFTLDRVPEHIELLIHHDEDAEVYLNGILATTLMNYTVEYETDLINEAARRALQIGVNTLAVHCHQTQGGQYIDVGLVGSEQ